METKRTDKRGTQRTYGRGAGERKFEPIPLRRPWIVKRTSCIFCDPLHAPYPQTGAYASEEPDKPEKVK